jgi:Asp-tRNA(Asn)/Glu-tRNA(Gln) amidotransferase A subunit family amidase
MQRIVPNLAPVELPTTRDIPIGAIGGSILSIEAAAAFDDLTRSERDDLMTGAPETSSWPNTFRAARLVPAVEYINANRARTLLMQKMHEAIRDVDVFIMPNTALQLTNLTGHPQIALPAGFTSNGTPVTICFLGQLFAEDKLLRVAQAWQDATEHHTKHPPQFIG